MSMSIHQQNNTNGMVCANCNTKLNNCIVRDNKFYCNTACYTNVQSTQVSDKKSKMYGTCATCKNTWKKCCIGSIDEGDKWFCGKTCHNMSTSRNMCIPANMFPFATTTYTVFPLSVNSRNGKMVF